MGAAHKFHRSPLTAYGFPMHTHTTTCFTLTACTRTSRLLHHVYAWPHPLSPSTLSLSSPSHGCSCVSLLFLVDMLPHMAVPRGHASLHGSCSWICFLIWQLLEDMLPYMAAAHRQGGGRGNGSKRSGKGERDQDPGKPSLSWRHCKRLTAAAPRVTLR